MPLLTPAEFAAQVAEKATRPWLRALRSIRNSYYLAAQYGLTLPPLSATILTDSGYLTAQIEEPCLIRCSIQSVRYLQQAAIGGDIAYDTAANWQEVFAATTIDVDHRALINAIERKTISLQAIAYNIKGNLENLYDSIETRQLLILAAIPE